MNVFYGVADDSWAEEDKFGWTIIGPVCLDQTNSRECDFTAPVNRVTVQREDLPVYDCEEVSNSQAFNAVQRNGPVALLASTSRTKDVTCPQQIREMMELDYSELHHSRKVRGTEQVESIEDKRFCHILRTGIHKNQEGNWEAPLPFKRGDFNLPNNREHCVIPKEETVQRSDSKEELCRLHIKDI